MQSTHPMLAIPGMSRGLPVAVVRTALTPVRGMITAGQVAFGSAGRGAERS